MKLIVGWAILTVAVLVTVVVMPGIDVDWTPGVYWAIAAVFALVNVVVGSTLRFVALPIAWLTLGLFSFVVNAVLLLVTDWLVDSLHVESFWAALGGSVVISLFATLLETVSRSVQSEVPYSA